MALRKKDDENLSDKNVEKVISLLESETPITKKEACRLLNISYNTTRLDKIISEYSTKKDYKLARRKQLRNTPLSDSEIKTIIQEYLANETMENISASTYRSAALIKRTLKKYNIPLRDKNISYQNPLDLEFAIVKEEYNEGDLVFSARYNSPAIISKKVKSELPAYRIWVYNDMQYAVQPYFELADLTEVQTKFGIKIEDMPKEEINQLIYEALTKAKKEMK